MSTYHFQLKAFAIPEKSHRKADFPGLTHFWKAASVAYFSRKGKGQQPRSSPCGCIEQIGCGASSVGRLRPLLVAGLGLGGPAPRPRRPCSSVALPAPSSLVWSALAARRVPRRFGPFRLSASLRSVVAPGGRVGAVPRLGLLPLPQARPPPAPPLRAVAALWGVLSSAPPRAAACRGLAAPLSLRGPVAVSLLWSMDKLTDQGPPTYPPPLLLE